MKPVVLLVLLALLAVGCARAPTAAPASTSPHALDWLLVYWMCYDNNLERHGPAILDMLEAGVASPHVGVVVFVDFRDRRGMRAVTLTADGRTDEPYPSESSAREATLADALRWTGARFDAAHLGLVFLDHGGRLGEMCLDEHPDGGGKPEWLDPARVGATLAVERPRLRGPLELVFVQQCGKGSLETLYALRGAAPLLMASQAVVGAPNYYYTGALRALSRAPDSDGRAVARLIVDHETPDMFDVYTLVSSAALEALPARLDAVLAPLLAPGRTVAAPELRTAGRRGPGVPVSFVGGPDEFYADGPGFLQALYAANGLDEAPLRAFDAWVTAALIVERRVSPRAEARAGDLGGFSLMLPRTAERLALYRDTPLYAATRLDDLAAALVPPACGCADDRCTPTLAQPFAPE